MATKKKAAKRKPSTKVIAVRVSTNCQLAGKNLSLKQDKQSGLYLGTVCKHQAAKRKPTKKKAAPKKAAKRKTRKSVY